MQRTRTAQAPNVFKVALDLLKSQGPAGLLRGYWATNSVWLPWNVLYIAMYEDFKQRVAHPTIPHGQAGFAAKPPPAWATWAASFSAAAIAAVLTHPPDVIKTRLQVMPSDAQMRATFASVLQQLVRKEGYQALWSGVVPRVLTIAPGASLSWMLYEQIKGWLMHKDGAAGMP